MPKPSWIGLKNRDKKGAIRRLRDSHLKAYSHKQTIVACGATNTKRECEEMQTGSTGLRSATNRAIFLDRDGVINKNRADHVKSWAEFEFLPDVFGALRDLATLDLPIIVITNQGAIGRELTTHEAVDDIHARMLIAVQEQGGRIDDVLYCPHKPEDRCDCRKPQPGLLKQAAERWHLDLSQCFLVGDAETDIQAGQWVGCRSLLVLTGRGHAHHAEMFGVPTAQNLAMAAKLIRHTLDLGGDNVGLSVQYGSPFANSQ